MAGSNGVSPQRIRCPSKNASVHYDHRVESLVGREKWEDGPSPCRVSGDKTNSGRGRRVQGQGLGGKNKNRSLTTPCPLYPFQVRINPESFALLQPKQVLYGDPG